MNSLFDVLTQLVRQIELGESDKAVTVQKFEDAYVDCDFSNSYYSISLFLEKRQPDELDNLEKHIEEILYFICTVYPEKGILIKCIEELYNYVKLENIRLKSLSQLTYIGRQAFEDRKVAEHFLRESNEKIKENAETIKSFHAQSVTILGIFSGLVIAFSMSGQLLLGGFNTIGSIHLFRILLYISMISLFVFNIVFMLMYTVSKISGKSIASSSGHRDSKYAVTRLRRKYPYVFYFNIATIIICGGLMYLVYVFCP